MARLYRTGRAPQHSRTGHASVAVTQTTDPSVTPAPDEDAGIPLQPLLLFMVVPSALIVAGSLCPWVSIFRVSAAGTEFTRFRWGIWTLLAGLLALWLLATAHFLRRSEWYRAVYAAGAVCVAICLGALAYALSLIGIGGVDFGWYLVTIGAAGLACAVWRLAYSPDGREVSASIGLLLLALGLGIFSGVRAGGPLREARANLDRASKELGVQIPMVPPPALTPGQVPFVMPQLPEPKKRNVTVHMNRQWETQQLGSTFMVYNAAQGKKYVVLNVTVTNNDPEELYVSDDDIDMVATDRNVYSSSSMAGSVDTRVNTLRGHLLQGGSATGDVVFEIGTSASPVEVRYSSLF